MLYRPDGEAQHAKKKAYGSPGSKKAELEEKKSVRALGNSVVSTPRVFSYKVEQKLPAFDFCPATQVRGRKLKLRSFHDKNMWER